MNTQYHLTVKHGNTLSVPQQLAVAFELPEFDTQTDYVIADLAALLKDSNIDTNQENTPARCMSDQGDADCAPLFCEPRTAVCR